MPWWMRGPCALVLLGAAVACGGSSYPPAIGPAPVPVPSGGRTGEPILNQPRPDANVRFGLTAQERREIFREVAAAEARAVREAREQIGGETMDEVALAQRLTRQYKAELAAAHGVTTEQIVEIGIEGYANGWSTSR